MAIKNRVDKIGATFLQQHTINTILATLYYHALLYNTVSHYDLLHNS